LGEAVDGSEPFRVAGEALDLTLLDFWRWSESDLLGTSTRGRLAEFIVATLLGARAENPRPDRSTDLLTADGIAVRVKSASFAKSECRRDLAKIHFTPLPWRAPRRDPEGAARLPRARAYVFALLGHAGPTAVNPLDLAQWRFFVPPTLRLEEKMKNQRSLALFTLVELSGGAVAHGELRDAVRRATRG
jgi:hypothetical protein